MEIYYGVIYYKDGTAREVGGTFTGPGAQQNCERATQIAFEQAKKVASSSYWIPTRYEVKIKR